MHVCTCHQSVRPGQREGQTYQLIGPAINVGTGQELVSYRGVGGRDDGVTFVTTQVAWAERFQEQSVTS